MSNANRFSIRHYLSERFRLRFEDANIEEMEENEVNEAVAKSHSSSQHFQRVEAGLDRESTRSASFPVNPERSTKEERLLENGAFRTLDGELAGDEMEQDAINYQILLGKIDVLLERLRLDA